MSESLLPDPSASVAVECVAAYLETAFSALDRRDLDAVRACLRRMAQHLLEINRWDAVNGGRTRHGETLVSEYVRLDKEINFHLRATAVGEGVQGEYVRLCEERDALVKRMYEAIEGHA